MSLLGVAMPDLPIYLKRSSVSGKVPTAADLAYGELALNYTDGKLYFKLSNDVIHQIPDRANNDLRYLLQAGGTMTGTLVINELTIANSTMSGALQVRGGLGVGGSIYASDVYSNGLKIEAFNTSTLVAQSVSATTSNFATTSGFAQSFNTSTLVANAVSASTSNYATTSGFAQSFNTSTLVANAVSATTASFATTSGYAESFNTSTLVANAVSATTSNYATTSGYAQSFNTSTLVANAVSATTSNYATTSGYAESFNTATLVSNAVTAQSLGTGIINIHNATSSSYYGDGALIVAGGVGIANGLNVYGNTNITGNLSVSGSITGTNISVTVNQVTATSGVFFGDDTGAGALYAGIPGYTPFGQTMFQAAGNFNDYMEINVQNINPGTKNSTDIVASADNVGFNNSFIDMGITGSGWDGSQHYSFGTVLNPNDGYLLVGHNTVDNRGSLVIGTTTSGTNIKFVVAATNASSSLTQVTSESVAMSINPAGTLAISTTTGALVVVGGVGISDSLHAGNIYSNGILLQNFSTSTLVANAVSATTSNYATTSGFAQSFNTSTLVANAVSATTSNYATTSGFAQSFNTSTLVANAVSATTSNYATTSGFAQSFNTSTLVANAVSATNFTSGRIDGRLVLSPGANSTSAWTTNGVALIQSSATYTDLTSSGTVAATYVNLFGAPTVAATNTTTYTEAYNTYFKSPVAGTNTAITSAYALGADSLSVNGSVGVPLGGAGLIFSVGSSQSNSTIRIGGASQTGELTFGRSTVSQTTYIQASANTSGTIKTINFGTSGLTNSNTLLNIGPVLGTGTFAVNAGTVVTIANTASSNSTTTGALQVVGGVGVGGNLNVGGVITATNIYVGTWPVSTGSGGGGLSSVAIQYNGASIGSATTINFATGTTATVTGSVVTLQVLSVNTASFATTSGFAQSFNTSTLVANAVSASTSNYATTSGFAQSFNTSTLVANAVSASTSNYATTSGFAQSFNTSTLVANAVSATTASFATTSGYVPSYQTTASITNNVLTINLTTSTLFNVNMTAAINTVTITNVAASGTISSFILALNNQGSVYSVVWPTSFRWSGGTAPTLTGTLNKKDVIVAYTDDSGSNYYAFVSGNNL